MIPRRSLSSDSLPLLLCLFLCGVLVGLSSAQGECLCPTNTLGKVCGSDGNYYNSSCLAQCANVTVLSDDSLCQSGTTTLAPVYVCPANSVQLNATSCACSSGNVCYGSHTCQQDNKFPLSCTSCFCANSSIASCSSQSLATLTSNYDCACSASDPTTFCDGNSQQCGIRSPALGGYAFFRPPCANCFCITPIADTTTTTTSPSTSTTKRTSVCSDDSNCTTTEYCYLNTCTSCLACSVYGSCPSRCSGVTLTTPASPTQNTTTAAPTTTITTTTVKVSTTTAKTSLSTTTTSTLPTTATLDTATPPPLLPTSGLCGQGLKGAYLGSNSICHPWTICSTFHEEISAPSSNFDRSCSSLATTLDALPSEGRAYVKVSVVMRQLAVSWSNADTEVVFAALKTLAPGFYTIFSSSQSGATQTISLRISMSTVLYISTLRDSLKSGSTIATALRTAASDFGRQTQFASVVVGTSVIAVDSKGSDPLASSSSSSSSSSNSGAVIAIVVILVLVLVVLVAIFFWLRARSSSGSFSPVSQFDDDRAVVIQGFDRRKSTTI